MEYVGTFAAYSKKTGDFICGGYILADGALVDNDGNPCKGDSDLIEIRRTYN